MTEYSGMSPIVTKLYARFLPVVGQFYSARASPVIPIRQIGQGARKPDRAARPPLDDEVSGASRIMMAPTVQIISILQRNTVTRAHRGEQSGALRALAERFPRLMPAPT
jgi:hypothetical protein